MKASLSDVLQRAGEFFMGTSPIHAAAARIAKDLSEIDVPFAIAGALAVNVHGHTLCANMNETPSMTPVQYEGDEVNHHDDKCIQPRSPHEQR